MENRTDSYTESAPGVPKAAELTDACVEKIQQFERELNKQGFWNIALVAYQLKN